jgi:hypothetical protein
MENFRQFEAGPDPFGRKWQVLFKWLQTAISLRHADTIDVKFVLRDNGNRVEKVIAMQHADMLELARNTGRPLTDPFCARIAALHLTHMVESGEDLEKNLVTLEPQQLARYAEAVQREERAAVEKRKGAA